MQFYALIEEWPGECMAFFRELPGCYCSAPTYQEMVEALPGCVADYFRWLKSNGITVLEEFDGIIEIAEKERIAVKDGEKGPRFEADLPPPDDKEIDNALNVAAAARAAILELYELLSPEQQHRQPSPGSWSMTGHLQHLYEAEAWYVSRLEEHPDDDFPIPADLAMALFDKAMDYELLLRALTPEQRQRLFTNESEEWTAAKVLRRMTEHLREHYPWMEEVAKAVTKP
jgi:DinB superfamily